MKAIQNALKAIVNFFDMVISVVTSFVDGLAQMMGYIGDCVSTFTDLVATLPSWLQVFALIVLGVSVTYLILGRSGGKSD